jgi:hypothetical protein
MEGPRAILVDQYFDIVLQRLQDFAELAIDVITERLVSKRNRPPPGEAAV